MRKRLGAEASWYGIHVLEQGMEDADMKTQLDGSQRPGGMGRASTQVPWQEIPEPK